MTDMEQRKAAKQFINDWKDRGDEKQDTQSFWLSLLRKVYCVADPANFINFEVRVKLSHTSFIDGFIKDTRVLIEQKGQDIDLRKGYKQSDGSMLTPFQQARRYAGYLPHDQNPRWIVVCNFQEFHIHDMNRPNDTPEIVRLEDLEKEYSRLNFLVDTGDENIKREMEISIQAGELVGKLYDAFQKQYKNPESDSALKSLNMLCVRLVFCLYAEDAGIFGKNNMFHDYMRENGVKHARQALIDLFRVLDTKYEDRESMYLDDDLAAFPYVNGGLFSDENIEIPQFNQEIFDLLLTRASEDFNWSEISPTIFGAVFESTLNPDTRRKGGMHYTSIENIHKVIDPLFLDDLRAELNEICETTAIKPREKKLLAFQEKIASLKFLDPACGSGNFLTETYLSLRKLENEALSMLYGGQIMLGIAIDPIKVSIGQFYGIEINDFAATVAKTALWIAESQMMKATEDIVHMNLDFLPLKSYVNIVEGNALRIDWETVVPKDELNYIMGNPPFVGARLMSSTQRDDIQSVFGNAKAIGSLDYVSSWYLKAAQYMSGTPIIAAFVSTNSITQGEQVELLWNPMLKQYNVQIVFCWRTFKWESEASEKAAVHCVIVGFTTGDYHGNKTIFVEGTSQTAQNISPYLVDAPDIIITNRNKPLCKVPEIITGNQATDDGNFYISEEEHDAFLANEPKAEKFIRVAYNGHGFINGKKQYCLWLVGASPAELKQMPHVMERISNIREYRLKSPKASTRNSANTPTLFTEIRQPESSYIVVPKVSSENRRYIPLGFLPPEVICNNTIKLIPNATAYQFGVLSSNVHNSWMRSVAGRMKSDYQYSNVIVYNNFPWPNPTDAQKAKIEKTAQAILDARALYPDCSLADLYDEVTMPPELRKAHQQNDRAVMEAYGFWGKLNTETDCVAALMEMYARVTK